MTFLDPDHLAAVEHEQARTALHKADQAALRHAARWTPPEHRRRPLRRFWRRILGR